MTNCLGTLKACPRFQDIIRNCFHVRFYISCQWLEYLFLVLGIVQDQELFDNNYMLCFNSNGEGVKRGGSVRHELPSVRISLKELQDLLPGIDIIECRVNVNNSNIFIFFIYMQPNSLNRYQIIFDYFFLF